MHLSGISHVADDEMRPEDSSMQDPGLPTLFLFPSLLLLLFLLLSFTLLILIFLKPNGGTA